MKKNLLLCLLSFIFTSSIFGQTVFQKSLDLALDTAYIRCVPDGKSFFVVGKTTENGQLKVHFLKISNNGDLLWYTTQQYYDNYALKAVTLQTDGIVALIGTTVDAYIVKINSQNGTSGFQKHLGNDEKMALFEAATDDKDNIWLSGLHERASDRDSTYYFQMKMDKNAVPRLISNNVYRTVTGGDATFAILQYYKPTDMTWHTEGKIMASVRDIGAEFTHGVTFGFNNRRDGMMVSDTNMVFKQTGSNYDIAYMKSNAKYFLFGAVVIDFPTLTLYGLNKKFTFGLVSADWRDEVSIRETDDDVMQPVHSFGNDIVFYSPRYKTLTKYNEKMQPLWTKKYDFCTNTTGFSADIALDGSIFTLRKIGKETIISRMNADGNMPTCLTKEDKPVVDFIYRATPKAYRWTTIHGERPLPIYKDTTRAIVQTMSILTPFCVKSNAIFNIPDTVCINTMIKPTDVDTMRGLKHDWTFLPNFADTSIPSINLHKVGSQRVFHRIQFGQCEDSLTKFVYVEPMPVIKLNDTLICGQKSLAINLTDKNIKNYFLNTKPTNPIITIDSSGLYTFKIASKACATEKKVKIKINDFTIPKITQVGLPCSNEAYPIVFDKVFKNILWDNQLVNTDTIFVKNSAVHTYSLTYKLDTNCIVKGTAQIKRKICTDIYVPTAFSPNNDQKNDEFEAFPQANFQIVSLMIFDRWGELVFRSTDNTKTWDGKFKGQECSEGTYIYVVNYMNIKTSTVEIVSGDLNLIR
jgi:gliding motility-associated-like protein